MASEQEQMTAAMAQMSGGTGGAGIGTNLSAPRHKKRQSNASLSLMELQAKQITVDHPFGSPVSSSLIPMDAEVSSPGSPPSI